MRQIALLKSEPKSYGGELLKTRKGRAGPRPLDTRNTMHLVLRSSKAKGYWSFSKERHRVAIRRITDKFAGRHGVRILSLANVGNHLHFHIKLTNRFTYRSFIRALTAAIAMAVTGTSRWKPLKSSAKDRFWDYRPYTRVVQSFRALLNLRDYIRINQLEGHGYRRDEASFIMAWNRASRRPPDRAIQTAWARSTRLILSDLDRPARQTRYRDDPSLESATTRQ